MSDPKSQPKEKPFISGPKELFSFILSMAFILFMAAAYLSSCSEKKEPEPKTSYTSSTKKWFGNYECKDDCSGHKAGYEWADENYITSDWDCSGNSESFIEGCYTYVEEYEAISDDR